MKAQQRSVPVDPEPVTVILSLLGAAGSVASLLSYADWKREVSEERDRAARVEAFDALGDAEVAMADLSARTEALGVMIAEGTRDRPWTRKSFPLRFGELRLYFSKAGMKRWQQLVSQTNSTSTRLHRAVSTLLGQLACGEFKLSRDTVDLLRKMESTLNEILIRLGSHERREDEIVQLAAAVAYGQQALESLRRELEEMFG